MQKRKLVLDIQDVSQSVQISVQSGLDRLTWAFKKRVMDIRAR